MVGTFKVKISTFNIGIGMVVRRNSNRPSLTQREGTKNGHFEWMKRQAQSVSD